MGGEKEGEFRQQPSELLAAPTSLSTDMMESCLGCLGLAKREQELCGRGVGRMEWEEIIQPRALEKACGRT